MIRATLDTNVLVSALEFGGIPGRLLNLHTDEAFCLCTSHTIMAELRRTLMERFEWKVDDVEYVVAMTITFSPAPLSRNPASSWPATTISSSSAPSREYRSLRPGSS